MKDNNNVYERAKALVNEKQGSTSTQGSVYERAKALIPKSEDVSQYLDDLGTRIGANAETLQSALAHKDYEKAKAGTKKMLEESTLNTKPYATSEDAQKEVLQGVMDEKADEARARGVQEYLDSTIGTWSADRVSSIVGGLTDADEERIKRNAERVSQLKKAGETPVVTEANIARPEINVQLPQNMTEAKIQVDIDRAKKSSKVSFSGLADKSKFEASKIVADYLAENPHMEANKEMLENYVAGNIYNDTFKWKLENDEQFFADAFEASTGKSYAEYKRMVDNEAKTKLNAMKSELKAMNETLKEKRDENRTHVGQSRAAFSSAWNDLRNAFGGNIEEIENLIDEIDSVLEGTFSSGFDKGFDFDRMATSGLSGVFTAGEMAKALEKAKNGDSLTEEEANYVRIHQYAQELNDLKSVREKYAEQMYDKFLGFNLNSIGEGIGTTVEMLPEFALAMTGTGALGSFAKLGGKAALKAALKAGGKELFKYGVKTTGKLGYNFGLAKVRGMAAAPFMPSTYNTYLDNLNSAYSFDDEGNLTYTPVDKRQAALGAWFSTANEISSEYLGAGIGKVVGWGARGLGRMVAGTKLAEAAVGVGQRVRKHLPKLTPQAKVAMRTLGVQADPVSETLSEALGDIMTSYEQTWIGMDVDKSQYGTMDYWMTLMGVSLAYGGTIATMGAVKSYRDVKKAVKVREDILGGVTNRNLYNTLVAISTSDDVVLASSALADFDWKGNYGNAVADMEADMKRANAYVAADLNVKILESAVEEESRLGRFRGTIEGVRNIVYQGKAGEYSDIIREAEMDGKKVYIINGYEANTNQYIVVDATTGEKTSVDKSKVTVTRELDVDTYIQEAYTNTFSLEAEKQRVADVKAKALQLDNPTEKDVARVASTLGIALPKVGNTVMLANGNMGAVTEALSPTEYAVQDPSGATYKVHFTDILSTDKLTATAQGALARGEVAAPIAPVEETTQPTEVSETTTEVAETTTPDDNGITIGAEVTVDGRVGKVRARTQDGKYAVAFEAESGNYEDTEVEFFTGEELSSLMGIAPAPTAEAPEVAEAAPTEMATTEDGSVDVEQMSAEDAAKALIQRAGTIEEAIAQVKQVIETVTEERKKAAKAEKKASLNDIGKKSAELQALDTRLEFYGEVLGVLETMLAEQQEQNMTEAQNIAEEAGVAPETTEASDTTTEENKPVERPTSGLIRNGAEMKFTDNVIKMVDFIAKRLGITVEFADGLKNEAGQAIDGDIKGKHVRISTSGQKGIKFIMGHEFFHRMKDIVDEQTYTAFVESVKEYAGEKQWNVEVARKRNVYRNHNAKVAEEAMAKMSNDDVAKIAARLNINIEGLSLEDAKDAVIDGAAMGKEQGVAEVDAIFPKMLSYDDALMVEECAADVAGKLVTNTNAFAKYVEDNSSNIALVRGLRKAIRAMRDFFDSFGYTDQHRKLNALEKSLANVLNEAAKNEAKAEKKVTEGKTRNSLPSLVGVHNISLDKLRKVIKMGGLANPSVAVIDVDKQTHDDYGEYSLVLPKNMVDARQGKNAGTWAGDAWTPTYPSIIKRMKDDKSYSRFHKDIEALPEAMRNKVRLEFNSFMEGRSADPLAYWYLFEKGSAPELVLVPSRYSDEVANAISEATKGSFSMYGLTPEERAKCLEVYIAVKFNGDKTAFENDLQERIARLTEAIETKKSDRVKKWAQSNIDAIKEYGFDYDSVADFIRDVQYDVREKGKVNEAATIMAAREQIKANNLEADYETWLNGLEERYGIEEYIFDGYTNSGNRRYLPHTVENASKWMKKQGRQGAVATFPSFGTFVAVSIPKMTTLESIRKRKALLGKSKEEYDAFREKWENVYYELGKKLQPDAKGFDDYGYWRLIEAVGHNNPKEFIKKQYNIELSEEDMAQLNEMLNAIRTEYPARYFETKFERPLQLSDFTAAVVPNDIPLDVESRLKDAGVEVIEYEKGDNASRAEAMQKASQMENVRFSLSVIQGLSDALNEYKVDGDITAFVEKVRDVNERIALRHPMISSKVELYDEGIGDAEWFAEKIAEIVGDHDGGYAPYTAGGVRYSIVTDQIEHLFIEAVAGNLTGKPIAIGVLTQEGKDYLEKLSGLKFKDKVSFTLNPSDLVHIHNDHFGGNEKDKGNNIPLTTLDIKRIVDVISFPTAIMYGKEKDSGRNLFYFLMDTGAGTYNLLEVYSDRKGNLSTKTYYKTKKDAAQRVMELKNSLLPTSETYSGAILSDTKIPQIFELPKIEVRNSLIPPEIDATYMDAVNKGDMETAQQMVMEAAKLAMPNTKVVDENGNPKVVYHGTGSEFYTFRKTNDINELGAGYYFSDSYEMAERYATDETLADNRFRAEALAFDIFTDEMGHSEQDYDDIEFVDDYNESYALAVERLFGNGRVMPVFLNIEKPRILSRVSPDFDPVYQYGFNYHNEGVMAKRYNDGVIDEMFTERHNNLTGNQYVAFSPNQIKSADPVTYDDNGNVIPLSERFNPEKEDIRYSLIGEQGASALDAYEEATTRLDNLNVAREMEAQGKDALVIKQATGWERGKDGLWRYEVADSVNMFDFTGNVDYMRRHPEYKRYKELLRKRNAGMMFFKKGLTKEEQKEFDDLAIVYGGGTQPHNSHKLKDYLDSEELFAAYPQLRDVNVEIKAELDGGANGIYSPSSNTIELATRAHEKMARTLFHEIQHAIQFIEGFAEGGNKEMADPRKKRERKEAMDALQRKIDMRERTLARFEAELAELNESMSKWWESHPEAMSREDFDSEMQALNEVYDMQLEKAAREQEKLREEKKEYEEFKASSTTLGYEGYERLAGEAEARATTSRVGMSEEERRSTLTMNDEDVARKDQIILRNGLYENYAEMPTRYHLPDPDPSDVFFDEIPIFDEQGNEVDITTLTSEEAKEILDGKVHQMLEAEYDHAVVAIRREAEEARQAVKEVYRAEKEKRRKGAKAARTNAARIDEIFGDTPFESLPYEVQALILIATGEAKIYWGDRGNKRGLASELGLKGSTGDRHAYRNIWGGAKKSFDEVVHEWWESLGGHENGIDTQDLRNALISALQSVQSSKDAMQEIVNKYDDLATDRDNALAEVDRNEEKELREAKAAYEQHLANFELAEGEERAAYHDRAAQFFGNQSLSRVEDILEDLAGEIERNKRKIERLKAENKDVYGTLAEGINKSKEVVLRALERLRMFAGMEEVDLNDVARLINLVKTARSQRQMNNLSAQATALVQRVSIKKAKTNLMRLLSLKLSNTDIIHKMLKESDTWTKEEREAILKHLWKVSRNGLRVSKAVHKDTKEIVNELKSLVDAFRKSELKGLNDEQKAKIIEAKLAEVEKELHPEVVYDDKGNVQDNANLPTDFNAENKHLAKFFFKSYLEMLAKEAEYHNASAELREKIDNKEKTDGANAAVVVARENYLNALNQFNSSLESLILEGKDKLRDWNAQKEKHEIEIRSMGIRAIGGEKASGQDKRSSKMARARAKINTTVNAPYWTFETVLEKIDHNSPYKKGKLYTYFMDKWADANDDLINRYAAHMEEIAEVMRKCFPDDAKNILKLKRNPYALYQYIMRKAESTPIGTLTYKEMGENGKMRDAQIVLNVANAMYVIAMWRQPRYQEAMQEKHGITQSDIDALMTNIASVNAGFLDFMDWVNETFLPSTRLEYDVVYRKMNGGSMPKEINYFPARVAGHKEVDLANIDNGALPTTPSALKDRMSAHIMPQLGMDYFKVLESHIQDMDNWAAYAELTADLNVLLSSDEFRRRCNDYMGGLGGDGGGKGSLYDLFKQTSLIATGMYRGEAGHNQLLGQLQKAWATSNIAFRGWTAVKQISSITTGMFDNLRFYKHLGIASTGVGIYHEIKNAMEISPSLRYRWKSGAAGMEALARETQREDGYTVQRGAYEKGKDFIGDAIKTLVRAGMTPNAAVDLLACSIIVNSVYETEIARLTGGKREATEEEKRAAVRKAERAFNTTQQSSEGAYLAPVQANPVYGVLTTYMNASFALHRKRMGGIKELWKLMTSKQYKRYLKDEFGADAVKISAVDAFKDILSGMAGELSFAMMGWGLMKVMAAINGWLNDDDDDEDVAAAKQEVFDKWWKPILPMLNGYLFGSAATSWASGFEASLTPAYDEFVKDVKGVFDDSGNRTWEVAQMAAKYLVGVDLKAMQNIGAGLEAMIEDDERAGAVLKFLNAPNRYIKAFVGDRREGETLEEYQTRIIRFHSLLEDVVYEHYFDEEGNYIGEDAPSLSMSKNQAKALRKEYEAAYAKNVLYHYGGEEALADYLKVEKQHKDICDLLGWSSTAKVSDKKRDLTDMHYALAKYQDKAAYWEKKRKNWVGSEDYYYDLLMDEQKAKNDLINNYYEYIKQTGLGAY